MGTFRGAFGILMPESVHRSCPDQHHPPPSARREPARKKAATGQGVEAITAAAFSLILAGNASPSYTFRRLCKN